MQHCSHSLHSKNHTSMTSSPREHLTREDANAWRDPRGVPAPIANLLPTSLHIAASPSHPHFEDSSSNRGNQASVGNPLLSRYGSWASLSSRPCQSTHHHSSHPLFPSTVLSFFLTFGCTPSSLLWIPLRRLRLHPATPATGAASTNRNHRVREAHRRHSFRAASSPGSCTGPMPLLTSNSCRLTCRQ